MAANKETRGAFLAGTRRPNSPKIVPTAEGHVYSGGRAAFHMLTGSVAFAPEMWRRIVDYAQAGNVSFSHAVRELVEYGLEDVNAPEGEL